MCPEHAVNERTEKVYLCHTEIVTAVPQLYNKIVKIILYYRVVSAGK